MASNTFVGRMIGAAMLDVPTYEAVEHDTTLTGQAATVVVLWALAAAVVAIRQALDVSTGKAILTGILGVLSWALIGAALAGMFVAS